CSSVYPEPSSGTPVSDAREFVTAYGQSIANATAAALETAQAVSVGSVLSQQQPLCILLENNLFKAAFAAGLFPDRPEYQDSACTVAAKLPSAAAHAPASGAAGGSSSTEAPVYLKSNVGVLTFGDVQLAYSPGEVFP